MKLIKTALATFFFCALLFFGLNIFSSYPNTALGASSAKRQTCLKDLEVKNVYSRETAGANGAVFMTLINKGDKDIRLINASVLPTIAKTVELHETQKDTKPDGTEIFSMHPIQFILIPSHGSKKLKPGAHHIMLIGLENSLEKGKFFSLTLDFGKHGTCTLEVPIREAEYQDSCGCSNH